MPALETSVETTFSAAELLENLGFLRVPKVLTVCRFKENPLRERGIGGELAGFLTDAF